MQISFSSSKFKKVCEDEKVLKMTYGDRSSSIMQRLNELQSAENLYDINKLPHTRLHQLKGNMKGYFAVDIKQPYRLLIWPENGNRNDLRTITKIECVKIENYH